MAYTINRTVADRFIQQNPSMKNAVEQAIKSILANPFVDAISTFPCVIMAPAVLTVFRGNGLLVFYQRSKIGDDIHIYIALIEVI
jgi:hypothetical protein